jgi:N-acetyl-gamma-glutamyl-phosphate reductase
VLQNMKISVSIVGASGYSGLELARILVSHPNVKITALTSERYAGQPYNRVFPALSPCITMPLEALDPEKITKKSDLIFIALPHKEAMDVVPFFISKGKKIVDLSADFRFKHRVLYEQWYQKHTAADLLKHAAYGLPELNRSHIKKAALVANPGCYPTGALIPLIPLIKEGCIASNTIIIDAKSGVSGAGRALAVSSLFCEASESLHAYKIASHRHQPEIEEQLSMVAKKSMHITFVPHLIPMNRGILSTIYVDLKKTARYKTIQDIYRSYYAPEQFIRILPQDIQPQTGWVRGSNYCDIGFTLSPDNKKLIIISAIDNLVKGAAGQAVQNMNIMLGLKEHTAIAQIPLYP